MSFKLDDLETFKTHRNKVSESLTSKFIGREREIAKLCDLLSRHDFVAVTGPAGIGKSRLTVAAIEKYVSEHKNVIVLCVKSFGDYLSAIEEAIDDSMEYLFLIDDANNYKKLDELVKCMKYHDQGNVKAIFTVRDYLKGCIDDSVVFYEIGALSDDEIKKAIEENTRIKNPEWLNKIANISKGNIRFAFVVTDVALKDERGFASLFNVEDIMNSFYKDQIAKMGNSDHLMISAGIISFFKSVYLNQLFYIAPVLKLAGISKQEFLHDADVLISMELLDECLGVVRMSDQCFADYLLNLVFIEKKYINIKDLIVGTYKYYKKRIIESLNAVLSTNLTEDLVSYVKKEALDACLSIEDIALKHDIEVAFAPLTLVHAAKEFKEGVGDYNDKKDIEWLLKLFQTLAKSEYCLVAIEGVMRLLKKTNVKKGNVFKAINEAFLLNYGSVETSFKCLDAFVGYLNDCGIHDGHFLELVSSYLKYSFRNSRVADERKLEFVSFNISDDIDGIIPFRRKCWEYVFSYGIGQALDAIMDFARYHIAENAQEIVKADLNSVYSHLNDFEYEELIRAVLYEELISDAKKYGFEESLYPSATTGEFLHVLLERKSNLQRCEEFQSVHEKNVRDFYKTYKSETFEKLRIIGVLSQYYLQNIKNLLLIVLDSIDEFPQSVLDIFIKYKVHPRFVIEKASAIVGLDVLHEEIKSIPDTFMRDEYLYGFYSFISEKGEKSTFGFGAWIKSKPNSAATPLFGRSVLCIRNIAENSNISYLKLVRIIFENKEGNDALAKEYLSYLLYMKDAFKELLDLDENLAIEIYEFLIEHGENDYGHKALKEIISTKRSYIEEFAKRYIENVLVDEDGLDEIVFNGDNREVFFNACIEMCKRKLPYFIPFRLQRFVSSHLGRQGMLDWILCYIDKNWNDDTAMESLFSILAGINSEYRNRFIIKYYEKGKDENVLRCALRSTCGFCSTDSLDAHFKSKIQSLESLKSKLIKWDNLNLLSYIDRLIEGCKEDLLNSKVSQLVERVDPDLMADLREIDLKTEVSLCDAFKLYVEDKDFHGLLSSDYASYKDGSFVTRTDAPLKFTDVLKDRKIIEVKVTPVGENERIRYEEYLSSMKGIRKRFQEGNQATLDECLYSLFEEKSWDASEFVEETALTRDIFSKIKNNQRNTFKKKTLVQILIGLRLPKPQRDYLFDKNGTQLSVYDEEDTLYDFILASKIDIDTADKLLKDLGKDGFVKEFSD